MYMLYTDFITDNIRLLDNLHRNLFSQIKNKIVSFTGQLLIRTKLKIQVHAVVLTLVILHISKTYFLQLPTEKAVLGVETLQVSCFSILTLGRCIFGRCYIPFS